MLVVAGVGGLRGGPGCGRCRWDSRQADDRRGTLLHMLGSLYHRPHSGVRRGSDAPWSKPGRRRRAWRGPLTHGRHGVVVAVERTPAVGEAEGGGKLGSRGDARSQRPAQRGREGGAPRAARPGSLRPRSGRSAPRPISSPGRTSGRPAGTSRRVPSGRRRPVPCARRSPAPTTSRRTSPSIPGTCVRARRPPSTPGRRRRRCSRWPAVCSPASRTTAARAAWHRRR